MKSNHQLLLGAVIAVILCGSASARTIQIDNWQPTGDSGTTDTADVNLALLPFSQTLTGVTSLSFSPGNTTGNSISGWTAASATIFATSTNETEFAFLGTGASLVVPSEQITISPVGAQTGAISEFLVAFNYSDGSDGNGVYGGTGVMKLNGVSYTASPSSSAGGTFDFDVVDGKLKTSGGGGGGGGSTSAPEIDPASATSALTLLAGGLAIVLGSKRRKLAQQTT